ncbi:MAG: DUF835 domain-containing protein [Candidatus Thermoplasmatota archaeon]|jgi:hypothetical protein|nr:DUF835 domain-containing protein [Candidatus Thermoplasmatota archaeon]
MSDNKVYKEGYRDGIKFALLAARTYGVSDEFIKRMEREYFGEDDETAVKLVYGETYLIYEKRNLKGMEIISGVAAQGFPAIVMSRDTKSSLKSFKNVKLAAITYDEALGGFNPTQLSQMQEYVISNLTEKGVLYIDCIDYIFSTSTSVQNVIKFLTVLKDKVLDKTGIFILSLNKDAIGKAELSMIEKEFKNTIKIKTD